MNIVVRTARRSTSNCAAWRMRIAIWCVPTALRSKWSGCSRAFQRAAAATHPPEAASVEPRSERPVWPLTSSAESTIPRSGPAASNNRSIGSKNPSRPRATFDDEWARLTPRLPRGSSSKPARACSAHGSRDRRSWATRPDRTRLHLDKSVFGAPRASRIGHFRVRTWPDFPVAWPNSQRLRKATRKLVEFQRFGTWLAPCVHLAHPLRQHLRVTVLDAGRCRIDSSTQYRTIEEGCLWFQSSRPMPSHLDQGLSVFLREIKTTMDS